MSARVDDLLRDLQIELAAAEPGPGFRHRARAYALAPRPRRRAATIAPLALAAAAALLILPRAIVDPRDLQLELPGSPAVTESRVDRQPVALATTVVSRPRPAAPPKFEVLIPPDQAIAITQWLGALRSARETRDAAVPATVVPAIAPVEVSPIQIELISVGHGALRERNR